MLRSRALAAAAARPPLWLFAGPPAPPPPPRRPFSAGRRRVTSLLPDVNKELKSLGEKCKAILPGSEWDHYPDFLPLPPEAVDVVIIGGGVIGWSIAYWLKHQNKDQDAFRVLVVEKDLCYTKASTVRSAGGIRLQYSMPENIRMSQFSANFLRLINDYLHVAGDPPIDIQFNPSGYLFLASEKGAAVLEENVNTQRAEGAKVFLLSPTHLKQKYPWLRTDDVALGSCGMEDEGWFDPWSLLNAFRRKAKTMGVHEYCGEVASFAMGSVERIMDGEIVHIANIKTIRIQLPSSNESVSVRCNTVVNAAGAWSGGVTERVSVGTGAPEKLSEVKLPVEPRKRYVYVFNCPDGPGLECPLVIDTTGAYFRREGLGGNYIGGLSPEEEEEPDTQDLEVDHEFFHEKVWPKLAHRVPNFESLKVKNSWAGYYDYNTFDQNAVIGVHPQVNNLYFATGFSGHGLQQSPAVGRGVAELILDNQYTTINLEPFSFKRLIKGEKVVERNII